MDIKRLIANAEQHISTKIIEGSTKDEIMSDVERFVQQGCPKEELLNCILVCISSKPTAENLLWIEELISHGANKLNKAMYIAVINNVWQVVKLLSLNPEITYVEHLCTAINFQSETSINILIDFCENKPIISKEELALQMEQTIRELKALSAENYTQQEDECQYVGFMALAAEYGYIDLVKQLRNTSFENFDYTVYI